MTRIRPLPRRRKRIVVIRRGLQPLCIHLHGVIPIRPGDPLTLSDDVAQGFVPGDDPLITQIRSGRLFIIGGDTGPENDGVGQWITAGNPMSEGVIHRLTAA